MDMLWPSSLILLGLLPILVALYIWILRRRSKAAVRYSSLSLVRAAMPPASRLRRHLPFALFLLALAALVGALSRPVSIVHLPSDQATIILAMDVSGSMRAVDIPPSRLRAAEDAALSFIRRQSNSYQIGIVAFARFAEIIQMPTNNQSMLEDAIRSLNIGRGTAVGTAILKSVDAIAEVYPDIAPTDGSLGFGESLPQAVPSGAYAPAIIVVLTDGVSNAGPHPVEVAQQAADRGIRIYTISFGTNEGSITFGGGQIQGGGPESGGRNFRVGVDEETLQMVAEMTGGEYYTAFSAEELQAVFDNLPTSMILRSEVTEISVFFTAAGVLLAALAIVLGMLWNPLP
jgi:Ca-activated chloride channel homolog